MEPKYSHRLPDGRININYKRYQREISGLSKAFWQLVYHLKSFKEVAAMDIETFLEAYAALTLFEGQDDK